MEDKIRSLTAMQATHESQMKQMIVELNKERGKLASVQLSLQGTHLLLEDLVLEQCIFEYLIELFILFLEEQKLNGSFQQDLSSLKDEKDKVSVYSYLFCYCGAAGHRASLKIVDKVNIFEVI